LLDQESVRGGDLSQRVGGPLLLSHVRRVGGGTEDHEVVVHHVAAIDPEAIGDELVLLRARPPAGILVDVTRPTS
jgi:hypothetical protein